MYFFERIAALRRGLGVGVRSEQLFGEPVPLGACGEKLLAGLVPLRDPVAQLGGETLQGFSCLGGLGARFLHLLGGGGGARLFFTPFAGKSGDLGERSISLRLEQIEVAAQRAKLAGARFQIGGETRGIGALVARFVRGGAQGGQRCFQVRLQAGVRIRRLGQVGREGTNQVGDFGNGWAGRPAGSAPRRARCGSTLRICAVRSGSPIGRIPWTAGACISCPATAPCGPT